MDLTGSPFPTTRWAVVAAVGGVDAERERALGELCDVYWPALYSTARARGLAPADAKDAVQDFLVFLIEKHVWERTDQGKGRMRAFLQVVLRNFINKGVRRQGAEMRGGHVRHLSIDEVTAERLWGEDAGAGGAIERIFDRRWAISTLERAKALLRERWVELGKGEEFDLLVEFVVPGAVRGQLDQSAQRLGISEEALRTRLSRLRGAYGDAIRTVVRQTLEPGEDLDEEIEALKAAVAG